MREDLIGYLLGALEPDEMQRITDLLKRDPELRQELETVRLSLEPLDEIHDLHQPPKDLLARTLAGIPAGPPTVDDESLVRLPAMRMTNAVASDRSWRFTDLLGMSIAVGILAGLILPGIMRVRAEARTVACQTQLRQAGTSFIEYLMSSEDRRFPELKLNGPEAFSGMYAVVLNEAGLLSGGRPMWCPSLDVPTDWVGRKLPTRQQLSEASEVNLVNYQQNSGGHYAYTLGILDRGFYQAPRFEGRTRFAILADVPMLGLGGLTMGHEGRGFNILFEDGHVEFIHDIDRLGIGDHPFLNHSGDVEAGLDPNDATLAPSRTPPFLPIRY